MEEEETLLKELQQLREEEESLVQELETVEEQRAAVAADLAQGRSLSQKPNQTLYASIAHPKLSPLHTQQDILTS